MCLCVCLCLGAQAGQCGGREQMSVIDGGRLNGELLWLSFCKLVRTDAITLTVDTGPSIMFTQSLHIQMGTVCACVLSTSGCVCVFFSYKQCTENGKKSNTHTDR